jgi:hypothetical protein
MIVSHSFQKKLESLPPWLLSVYAAVCSFCVYFCMYAFRKPFTAAGYNGMPFLHVDYKVWLVSAQVIGYMLSKFYGIKFISSMHGPKRANTIVILILFAWIALLLFAITPAPYNIIFLLINGFPLGMIWGLVFSYLEGRKSTEFTGAVLSVSFIFSSGVVKSAGKWIMLDWHISEFWMPFVTGAIFVLPMILFTFLLNHLPPPTAADVAMRHERKAMTKSERKAFVATFLPGLIMVVFTYMLLTILRDFRDNFANELFTELGFGNNASIFTETEVPVSLIVLLCMALLVLEKNNFKAFVINHIIIIAGYALTLLSTILFINHSIPALYWMVLVGTGLYLSYVPFNCLYFERMIATYRLTANVGFVMYISDSFGYLGSVLVLFGKQLAGQNMSWTSFFENAVIIISLTGIVGTALALFYFNKKYSSQLSSPLSYVA